MSNLNALQERIENLTELEIKQCYDEIVGYRKVGTLSGEALVRQIRDECRKELGFDSWDIGCVFTTQDIIFEIARRSYEQNIMNKVYVVLEGDGYMEFGYCGVYKTRKQAENRMAKIIKDCPSVEEKLYIEEVKLVDDEEEYK